MTVASPASSAQLLDEGHSDHSALKILISVSLENTCNIETDSQLGRGLCGSHLIIWDETVITHFHNLEGVVRTLRDLLL